MKKELLIKEQVSKYANGVLLAMILKDALIMTLEQYGVAKIGYICDKNAKD
jgi:hypothetical protein